MSKREKNLPRVLVVDDQPANLVAARTLLAPLPVEVMTASSGDEALGMVLRYEFAVILMDVRMPIMDGYETAFLIRGHTEHNPVPIIFVTAEAPEQHAMFQGYESGGVDYLLKPLDEDLLRSKISVFLELYRHKRTLIETTKALRQSNARMERLLEMATDGILGIEPDLRISFANPAACRMLACRADQLLHRSARDVLGIQAAVPGEAALDPFLEAAAKGRFSQSGVRFEAQLGRRFSAAYSLSAIEGERLQDAPSFVLVFQDQSEHERLRADGEGATLNDPLTGLPNGVWFEHRLAENLVRSGRNRPFAVLLLEIQELASLSSQQGAPVVDFLLRSVAERMASALRASDIAARVSEERFAVILPGVADPSDGLAIAQKLSALLTRPYALGGQMVQVHCCMGVALYPLHADRGGALLNIAEQALLDAKRKAPRQVSTAAGNETVRNLQRAGT